MYNDLWRNVNFSEWNLNFSRWKQRNFVLFKTITLHRYPWANVFPNQSLHLNKNEDTRSRCRFQSKGCDCSQDLSITTFKIFSFFQQRVCTTSHDRDETIFERRNMTRVDRLDCQPRTKMLGTIRNSGKRMITSDPAKWPRYAAASFRNWKNFR